MIDVDQRGRQAGEIEIGGVAYAAGMFWQLADEPARVTSEARSVASTVGVEADVICVQPSAPAQYGLGWTESNHKTGQRPLALAATQNIGGSFLGCFPVGDQDRYWFGRAKDGVIMPDGDALFDNLNAARDRFEAAYAEAADDVVIFAPDSWGIPGAKEGNLAELITKAPTIRLASRESALGKFKLVFVAVIVLLAAGAGAYWWFDQQAKERAAAERREQRAIQQAMAAANPWFREPLPSAVLDACYAGFTDLPLIVPGWSMRTAQCDGRVIAARWSKEQAGLIASLRDAAEDAGFGLQLGDGGTNAILSRPITGLPTREQIGAATPGNELWQGDLIRERLWEMGNRLGMPINLTGGRRGPPPPPPRGSDGRPLNVPPPPSAIDLRMSASLPVNTWSSVLDDVPGAVVETITWTSGGEGDNWQISARIYESQIRQLPGSN